MITKPVPALLCTPTRHNPTSRTTPELATALGRGETLSPGQKAVNRSHAKIRALVEQAMATLNTWRLLRKLRCSTTRIHSLRPSRPHPTSGQLRPMMEKAHCRTVSAVPMPSLLAAAFISAHSVSQPGRTSATMRTARRRSSAG
jgi:hypothetical protein